MSPRTSLRLTSAFHLATALVAVGCLLASSRLVAQDAARVARPEPALKVDGKTPAQWIKHLAHEDQEERDLAIDKLLEFEVPPVVELVTAWPAETQFATKLLDCGTQEGDLLDGLYEVMQELDLDALPDLIKLLEHKEERMRGAAAHFLGVLALPGEADWKTIPPLRKLLSDKTHYVREAAASSLGQIGGIDAAEAKADLEKLAKQDPDTMVRISAIVALAQIAASLAEEAGKPKPKTTVDPFILKALSNEDDYIRANAAGYLGELGEVGDLGTEALPELEKLFKDKSSMVRLMAGAAHWHISGKPTSLPVLVELLGAKESIVREYAALFVGDMGDKTAVEPLRKLAEEDPSRRVRSAARVSAEKVRENAPAVAPET